MSCKGGRNNGKRGKAKTFFFAEKQRRGGCSLN